MKSRRTKFDPSAGYQIEHANPLCDPKGRVYCGRQGDDPVPEPDPFGALAACGQEDLWRGTVRILFQEVVFDRPRVIGAALSANSTCSIAF